jgi:serine/threonine protein kinase
MRLRERRYKSLHDLMKNRIDPTFHTLVTASLELVDSFRKLHAEGMCYQDISFGNAFFDPDTGEVLVCDNDNVTANRSGICGVLGTPDFMAPEIVRREAVPSRETDLHSLAVLLFYMLTTSHPLYGRKVMDIHILDLPAREKLLGREPLFIFDPNDRSNEAVGRDQDEYGEAGANALAYWKVYPSFLQNAFVKAFTFGLKDPQNGRVMEGEWRDILSKLRDSIFYCGACTKENFYDPDAIKASGGKPPVCPFCNRLAKLPYRIRVGRKIIMLTHTTKLYPHHIDDGRAFDFSVPVAEVVVHPKDPNIWGLRNTTNEKWVITGADGVTRDVEPGKSAILAPNLKISFGRAEGEVRY